MWNININKKVFEEQVFQNVVYIMFAILFMPQCVDGLGSQVKTYQYS